MSAPEKLCQRCGLRPVRSVGGDRAIRCPDCHKKWLAEKRHGYYVRRCQANYVPRPRRPPVKYDYAVIKPRAERMIQNGAVSSDLAKIIGCPLNSVGYHIKVMFGEPVVPTRRRLSPVKLTLEQEWEQRLKIEHLSMDRGLSSKLSYGHEADFDNEVSQRAAMRKGATSR